MKFDANTFRLEQKGRFGTMALIALVIGAVLSIVAFTNDHAEFYHGWLVALAYWVSLGLGALFLTMVHHLANATWSVVIRRMTETLSLTLPVMLVAVLPMLYGMHELYHWTHEEAVAHDAILQWKAGYLNPAFFTVRTFVAFAIWTFIGWSLYRLSVKQDTEFTDRRLATIRRLSAGGMLLFALSSTMIGFDWLMSLDPHWYSTIFGVYFFAGGLLSSVCLVVVLAAYLRKKKVLDNTITAEHYHDLGKLAFGFIIFWAYIGFSQYLLQWYGNIPEETVWYLNRWEGSWPPVSMTIFLGHFCVPFGYLVFRSVKRSVPLLKAGALWILFMHFVDMYWLVYPTHAKNGPTYSLMELVTLIGPMLFIGGLFCWFFWSRFTSGPLVPVGDPKLKASITFVNQ